MPWPGRAATREDLPPPIFKKGILKLEDLAAGHGAKGTVLNVVDFGAFVDIGLKDSGLVHISQMANRYIKSPYDVSGALRLLPAADPSAWRTPVLTCSGLTGAGLDEVWDKVKVHPTALIEAGEFAAKRAQQQVDWAWSMVRDTLLTDLHALPAVRALVPEIEAQLRAGELTATLAASRILAAFAPRD